MELVNLIKLHWDRALALALAVISGLMMIIGWFRVSDGLVVTQQMPYVVSAGLGGLFLLGLAATLWLSADFRDEWRALDALSDTRVTDSPDPTLIDVDAKDADIEALQARIAELETRLAAVEAAPARNRTRKLRAEDAKPRTKSAANADLATVGAD